MKTLLLALAPFIALLVFVLMSIAALPTAVHVHPIDVPIAQLLGQ